MAVSMDDFISAVESIAPPEMAYGWDNSGPLLRLNEEVKRVLVTLDVTDEIVSEAEEQRCDMILAHHPLIFEAVKRLDCRRTADGLLVRLIKSGISLYAAHTSFDRAEGGMNDTLAGKLGLRDVEILTGDGEGLARVGRFEKALCVNELAQRVKNALNISALKVSQTDINAIEKAAVVGGSGGGFIEAAKNAGAQALITGEAKHNHFLDAQAQGVLLIEAGHFDTECCFTLQVFMSLQSRLNELQLNVELCKARGEKPPYKYI